jgi:hypothetical protein
MPLQGPLARRFPARAVAGWSTRARSMRPREKALKMRCFGGEAVCEKWRPFHAKIAARILCRRAPGAGRTCCAPASPEAQRGAFAAFQALRDLFDRLYIIGFNDVGPNEGTESLKYQSPFVQYNVSMTSARTRVLKVLNGLTGRTFTTGFNDVGPNEGTESRRCWPGGVLAGRFNDVGPNEGTESI